jgi:hypothetical protein
MAAGNRVLLFGCLTHDDFVHGWDESYAPLSASSYDGGATTAAVTELLFELGYKNDPMRPWELVLGTSNWRENRHFTAVVFANDVFKADSIKQVLKDLTDTPYVLFATSYKDRGIQWMPAPEGVDELTIVKDGQDMGGDWHVWAYKKKGGEAGAGAAATRVGAHLEALDTDRSAPTMFTPAESVFESSAIPTRAGGAPHVPETPSVARHLVFEEAGGPRSAALPEAATEESSTVEGMAPDAISAPSAEEARDFQTMLQDAKDRGALPVVVDTILAAIRKVSGDDVTVKKVVAAWCAKEKGATSVRVVNPDGTLVEPRRKLGPPPTADNTSRASSASRSKSKK